MRELARVGQWQPPLPFRAESSPASARQAKWSSGLRAVVVRLDTFFRSADHACWVELGRAVGFPSGLLKSKFRTSLLSSAWQRHRKQPYLSLNPYGRVPTLEENGFGECMIVQLQAHSCAPLKTRRHGHYDGAMRLGMKGQILREDLHF